LVPQRLTAGNLLGVVALFLGAGALVLASIPPLAFLTLPVAGLGLVLALAGCLPALAFSKGNLLVPAAGAGANLLVLLLAVLWLGLLGTLPFGKTTANPDADRIQAIPLGHPSADPGGLEQDGWVDASRAAVQQNDVRVQVSTVTVAPVEMYKVQSKPRFSEQKYLLLRLRILNVGAARQLPYETWNAAGRGPQPPTLTDNFGKDYTLKSADPDWQMTEQPHRGLVAPGRFTDELLVFEPPPADVEFLHVELPATACGGRDMYRLAIPKAMIKR
jgi:hypothetical protein